MSADALPAKRPIVSTIPARLDRLKWSPFHTRMVFGLGAAWILDGLQITISSSVTGVLTQPSTLDMTSSEIGRRPSALSATTGWLTLLGAG
jgi:hypothetical protein